MQMTSREWIYLHRLWGPLGVCSICNCYLVFVCSSSTLTAFIYGLLSISFSFSLILLSGLCFKVISKHRKTLSTRLERDFQMGEVEKNDIESK
ncbi:hypothetical protein BDV25DRAFT_151969 [Aspergillus avenaceus]|uniref:Uncharacterized protein n=1 Tax=Aspergillus avenaceus TaxID=36643 RepID=A0A5N6U0N3_ASPAV|nr:hypothetical protein BDV25DRAFT_151969 [Aspergillus avenaceus]